MMNKNCANNLHRGPAQIIVDHTNKKMKLEMVDLAPGADTWQTG